MNTVYVFGYGSLIDHLSDSPRPNIRPAILTGYRREWAVAMDNSVDIAGYKYYLDPTTQTRPPVYVSFLTITSDQAATTNGILIPTSAAELIKLDERELNYTRQDVTNLIEPAIPQATIYTYVGKPESRARYTLAAAKGRSVIDQAYLNAVHKGFAMLGENQLAEFQRLTPLPNLPVLELIRIDL